MVSGAHHKASSLWCRLLQEALTPQAASSTQPQVSPIPLEERAPQGCSGMGQLMCSFKKEHNALQGLNHRQRTPGLRGSSYQNTGNQKSQGSV